MRLHKNVGKSNHRKLLSKLISESEVSVLCSGWIKNTGVEKLRPAIDRALANNAVITIFSNEDHTDPKAAETLKGILNLEHFVAGKKDKCLHSKIYYFEKSGEYTAIIGSANITYGGLVGSEELSVGIEGIVGDDQHKQIQEYLNGLRSTLQK